MALALQFANTNYRITFIFYTITKKLSSTFTKYSVFYTDSSSPLILKVNSIVEFDMKLTNFKILFVFFLVAVLVCSSIVFF